MDKDGMDMCVYRFVAKREKKIEKNEINMKQ